MCGNERPGLPVKEDRTLGALRWFKRNITKNPKNYKLVVCKECYLNYRKKRNSYERKQIIYLVIGILFLVALTLSTRGNLGAIGFGIIIMLFLLLLSQLSYVPAVEMPPIAKSAQKK